MNTIISILFIIVGCALIAIGARTLAVKQSEEPKKIAIGKPFVETPKIAVIYLRSWWQDENTITRNYWFCVINNIPELEGAIKERPSIVTGYFDSPQAWRDANNAAWSARSTEPRK